MNNKTLAGLCIVILTLVYIPIIQLLSTISMYSHQIIGKEFDTNIMVYVPSFAFIIIPIILIIGIYLIIRGIKDK